MTNKPFKTNSCSHSFQYNLRQQRISHGLTTKALASFLNVDITTISHYENGSRCPNFDLLIQLSEKFNCTIDELIR